MNKCYRIHNAQDRDLTIRKILVIISWCVGLLSGLFVVSRIPFNTFSLMRRSFNSGCFSIVGFLLILSLPLLLSVITVAFKNILLMLPVLFIKAFLFSVSWFTLYKAYNSAGWLVCNLMLFPEIVSLFLALFYLFKNIEQKEEDFVTDYLISQIVVIIIGYTDFAVILPIWTHIIRI